RRPACGRSSESPPPSAWPSPLPCGTPNGNIEQVPAALGHAHVVIGRELTLRGLNVVVSPCRPLDLDRFAVKLLVGANPVQGLVEVGPVGRDLDVKLGCQFRSLRVG